MFDYTIICILHYKEAKPDKYNLDKECMFAYTIICTLHYIEAKPDFTTLIWSACLLTQ